MSQGKAIEHRQGKLNARNLYIKLKNGSVYRYPKPLGEAQQSSLLARIEKNKNTVQLKHWEKVEKKS